MKRLIPAFLFLSLPAFACLHFDKDYLGTLKEGTKTAILFHDGTSAHLVVRTNLKAEKGQLPKELAWVMPFPSLPTKYEEVSPAVFQEVATLVSPGTWGGKAARGGLNAKSSREGGIVVHETQVVGNYKIQPIEIVEDGAAKIFNEWLTQNHFNTMPDDLQKYYLKKGSVFLAIRAKLSGKDADLKPIHIVYPSDRLSFPVKFTHDTRTFNVDLFTLTKKPIEPNALDRYFFYQVSAMQLDSETWKRGTAPELQKLVGSWEGFLTKFQAKDLNSEGKALRHLIEDPSIPQTSLN